MFLAIVDVKLDTGKPYDTMQEATQYVQFN